MSRQYWAALTKLKSVTVSHLVWRILQNVTDAVLTNIVTPKNVTAAVTFLSKSITLAVTPCLLSQDLKSVTPEAKNSEIWKKNTQNMQDTLLNNKNEHIY